MRCYLCKRDGVKDFGAFGAPNDEFLVYRIECRGCGKFEVDDLWRELADVDSNMAIEQPRLRRLCGVVRQDTDDSGRCAIPITRQSVPLLLAKHADTEPRPLRQIERFVSYAATNAPHFGGTSRFDNDDAMATRLYFDFDARHPDNFVTSVRNFMSAAQEAGFVTHVGKVGGTAFDCTLTLKAWHLAEQLSKTKRATDQAFVAMWFHDGMRETFLSGIAPALRACGYNPYRVDIDPHNEDIGDVIITNLRKSALLVADLTGNRGNALYEAGFARALEISVVLTCNDTWTGYSINCEPNSGTPPIAQPNTWFQQIQDQAFDVRNRQILRWSEPADLAVKLENRLRAHRLNLK